MRRPPYWAAFLHFGETPSHFGTRSANIPPLGKNKETVDMYQLLCVAATIVTLIAVTGTVIGQENEAQAEESAVQHELVTEFILEPVNYRTSVKAAMQSHLRSMGLIVTLRTPLKEHMHLHAKAMLALSKIHGDLYANGSESPGTSAAIWSSPEAFAAAIDDLESKAGKLASAVDGGNRHYIFNTLTQLGESCENCHSQFRIGSE